jgi:hypothetical protein
MDVDTLSPISICLAAGEQTNPVAHDLAAADAPGVIPPDVHFDSIAFENPTSLAARIS